MQRSHNGDSHNADKSPPKKDMKYLTSAGKGVVKHRHKKKRRNFENRIIKDQLES